MFCMSCGASLPEGAGFCPNCGAAVASTPLVAQAPVAGTVVNGAPVPVQGTPAQLCACRTAARQGLEASYVPEVGAWLFVTKRMSMALANMHQYFFFADGDGCGYAEMGAYTDRCFDYAIHAYEGLPRGLQKGVVVYAVLCQHPMVPEAVAYTKRSPREHMAAFEAPVVLDPLAGTAELLEKTPLWGWAMWRGIRKTALETLLP